LIESRNLKKSENEKNLSQIVKNNQSQSKSIFLKENFHFKEKKEKLFLPKE
jgi:hypothetical protein